jgi:hypothetical protein
MPDHGAPCAASGMANKKTHNVSMEIMRSARREVLISAPFQL